MNTTFKSIILHESQDMLVLEIEWKGRMYVGSLLKEVTIKRIVPFVSDALSVKKSLEDEERDSGISCDESRDSDILDLLLDEADETESLSEPSLNEDNQKSVSSPQRDVEIETASHEISAKKKRGPKNKLQFRMAYNNNGEYVKIYKCHLCDKEYKYQSGVSNHFRQVHRTHE